MHPTSKGNDLATAERWLEGKVPVMNARCCRRIVALLLLLAVAGIGESGASAAPAIEPSYTIRMPGGQIVIQARLSREATREAEGGQIVRLQGKQTRESAIPFALNAALVLDGRAQPVRCRVNAGLAPGLDSVLEAARASDAMGGVTGDGLATTFLASIPEQRGTLAFGAPLVSAVDAYAFLGRRYDVARGGPQNFRPAVRRAQLVRQPGHAHAGG
jgi:hypothetical protein